MAFLMLRGNPLDELFDFRRDFDGMFERLLTGRAGTQGRSASMSVASPPIQAWVDNEEKAYHLRVALPGINPEEVQIEAQDHILRISGEHKATKENKDMDYLEREFSYERFERTVTLPEGVNAEKLRAEYNNGLLEITAPLSAEVLPRRIQIEVAPKAKGAGA
jgi:HSP20 family protein